MTEHNPSQNSESTIVQEIRKDFYSFRNGLIADTLRKSGLPHKYIFGLQLPQLSKIARKHPKNLDLAYDLWEDRESRESRLLATYIFPPEKLKKEEAEELIKDLRSREEAEILSFRLLRHLPYAKELAIEKENSDSGWSDFALHSLNMLQKALEVI